MFVKIFHSVFPFSTQCYLQVSFMCWLMQRGGLYAFFPHELLLQQDSRPALVPETVKVLQQSLYMQSVFLLPTEVDTYLRKTSF